MLHRWLLPVLALVTSIPAVAAGDTSLDRFLDGLQTWRGDFQQVVLDARGKSVEQGSGRLLVQRPGKFRWEYLPADAGADGGQLLVADGRNLWFYEKDLAQVTVKPVSEALSSTPIVLLSGDTAALRAAFDIAAAPRRDNLDWVSVQPRNAAADFSRAELAFRGNVLMRMVISDKLGQTVTLQFSRPSRNAKLQPDELAFKAPAGVDVIGTVSP